MTVETQSNIATYLGDGIATVFPFTFPVLDIEHLGVYVQLLSTGETTAVAFTADGIGDVDGGSITLLSPPAVGYRVIIARIVPLKQELDLLNQGGFYPENVEREFDLQEMQIQQIKEEIDRAVRVPLGDTITELGIAADRLGTVFGFSAATGIGELQTYANLAILLSPYMATLLSAINKGDPGGNVMAIGLFLDGNTIDIPVGTDIVRTSGYSTTGKGGAFYEYDAAVDAAYVTANPRSAFISSNGRGFKLSLDQQLNVFMFGAVGDDTANDGPAFVYAIQFSYDNAIDGTGFPPSAGPSLKIPLAQYYLGAQTLEITHTIDIFGEGSIGPFGAAASQLRWDDGTHGFRFQANDTTGDVGTGPQAYGGARGSRLRNLYLKGGYAGVESEYHGVYFRAAIEVENLLIDNFPGDGFCGVSHNTGGNTNCSIARNVHVRRCRDGARMSGINSQVGKFEIFATENRRWAVQDDGQLGNLWTGLAEENGKTVGTTPTMVSYNGHWYAVIAGQEAGASINAPSGDTTDNTWWYYANNDAGPNLGANVPAWVNGITVRAGGAFRTTNVNAHTVLLDWYAEGFQGPLQLTEPTLVLGGQNLAPGIKGVSAIHHNDFGIRIKNLQVDGQTILGSQVGSAVNNNVFIETTGTDGILTIRRWVAGVATTLATVQGNNVNGMYLNGFPAIRFFTGPGAGTYCGVIDEDGLDLPLAQGLRVNSTKVVGGQQAPINNDTSGAANQGTVNAILTALRNHGLIAT